MNDGLYIKKGFFRQGVPRRGDKAVAPGQVASVEVTTDDGFELVAGTAQETYESGYSYFGWTKAGTAYPEVFEVQSNGGVKVLKPGLYGAFLWLTGDMVAGKSLRLLLADEPADVYRGGGDYHTSGGWTTFTAGTNFALRENEPLPTLHAFASWDGAAGMLVWPTFQVFRMGDAPEPYELTALA